MTADPLLIASLLALVLWDVGRRFASRGRAVSAEELDHLVDRVTTCEAAFAQINAHGVQIASLKERVKSSDETHNTVGALLSRMTVVEAALKEHGRKLTADALKAQPLARPTRGPVFPRK